MTSSESPHPPTPQPRPRRKFTKQIDALLKKMVQFKGKSLKGIEIAER